MDLEKIAEETLEARVAVPHGISMQVLKVSEEAGELAGAFCRWRNVSRRAGSFDEVRLEIADVIIAASVLAVRLGINLEDVVNEKHKINLDRKKN